MFTLGIGVTVHGDNDAKGAVNKLSQHAKIEIRSTQIRVYYNNRDHDAKGTVNKLSQHAKIEIRYTQITVFCNNRDHPN
jgi:hypothetical protein